jgi:hypothetical protein
MQKRHEIPTQRDAVHLLLFMMLFSPVALLFLFFDYLISSHPWKLKPSKDLTKAPSLFAVN